MAKKANKREQTHIQVDVEDKEILEELRDKEGYASIAITLKKMIAKCLKKTNQVA